MPMPMPMPKADSVHSTPPTNTPIDTTTFQIADGLSEMEGPLFEVRNLAFALRMLGSSDDMPKGPGAALDALADIVVEKMDTLIEERERLWRLAVIQEQAWFRENPNSIDLEQAVV